MKKFIVLLISIPIVLFVILEIFFSINYFTSRRTAERFILPDNYEGWVLVELENPDCPALNVLDGYFVFPIGPNGTLCTSSMRATGWATDWYEYASHPKTNLMQNPVTGLNRIWHESHGQRTQENKTVHFYFFYVGPRKFEDEEFEKEMKKVDEKIPDGDRQE